MTRIERAAARRGALQTAESQPRPVALVELITTVLLALSTVVAATAVSIGIARADVLSIRADGDTAPLAIALLIGLLLLAMGGLTAIMTTARPRNATRRQCLLNTSCCSKSPVPPRAKTATRKPLSNRRPKPSKPTSNFPTWRTRQWNRWIASSATMAEALKSGQAHKCRRSITAPPAAPQRMPAAAIALRKSFTIAMYRHAR